MAALGEKILWPNPGSATHSSLLLLSLHVRWGFIREKVRENGFLLREFQGSMALPLNSLHSTWSGDSRKVSGRLIPAFRKNDSLVSDSHMKIY